jgi:hypothetical protein
MTEKPITITRAIKHKVSMNNYEGVEVFASVTQEVPGDSNLDDLRENFDGILSALLADDLDEAARTTAEKKTYIQYWKVEE